jgi:hypothetical protein
MTTERCITICSSQGHSIAATEYGRQCLCGSQLYTTGGARSTNASECSMKCDGESCKPFVSAPAHRLAFCRQPSPDMWFELARQRLYAAWYLGWHWITDRPLIRSLRFLLWKLQYFFFFLVQPPVTAAGLAMYFALHPV